MSAAVAERPLDRASVHASRAMIVLGLAGLAAVVVVFVRLIERWRVTPHVVPHQVSILGQRFSYPAANAGAIIVLLLAVAGAAVMATALVAIAAEVSVSRRLARRLAELRPVPRDGIFVIADEHPEAFCAGLLRPRVYLTTGALELLEEAELNAVLLHERHHARRRDPLRQAAGRVIERSLFFLPGVRELRHGQRLLVELGADERAAGGGGADRAAVARAMLTLGDAAEPGGSAGVDPARVDALLGEPVSWRFPALLCIAAFALLTLTVMTAILAGREAAGSATLAPPFLSAQPCIVMLAMVPSAIAVAGAIPIRGERRRRAGV